MLVPRLSPYIITKTSSVSSPVPVSPIHIHLLKSTLHIVVFYIFCRIPLSFLFIYSSCHETSLIMSDIMSTSGTSVLGKLQLNVFTYIILIIQYHSIASYPFSYRPLHPWLSFPGYQSSQGCLATTYSSKGVVISPKVVR